MAIAMDSDIDGSDIEWQKQRTGVAADVDVGRAKLFVMKDWMMRPLPARCC